MNDHDFKYENSSFDLIDHDRDGLVSFFELNNALGKFDENFSDLEVTSIMLRFDTDNKEQINFAEFLTAAVDRDLITKRENIEELFDTLDLNNDGKVDAKDISRELQNLESKIKMEEVQKLVEAEKTNTKGELTLEEFTSIIQKGYLSLLSHCHQLYNRQQN